MILKGTPDDRSFASMEDKALSLFQDTVALNADFPGGNHWRPSQPINFFLHNNK